MTSQLVFFIFFTLCILSTSAQCGIDSQEYNTIFFRANNFYREEKYEDAIQDYESLVSAGVWSSNIFYNLGNAYLRTGNKGKAILYYERAFRMRPRDADIRSNLDFARTLVEGSEGGYVEKWYERIFLFLQGFLSTNEMALLVSALYFVVMIFLSLCVYLKAYRRLFCYFAVIFFVLFAIVLPSFVSSVYGSELQKKAIVMVNETEVRFEPDDDATVHFMLYEGAVIQITGSQENWHRIRRYDGKTGWLKGDVFFAILPLSSSFSDYKTP